jgi:hypothetical protein
VVAIEPAGAKASAFSQHILKLFVIILINRRVAECVLRS